MDQCSIEDCSKPVRARGWCAPHYYRWSRHGDPKGGGNYRSKESQSCSVADCDNSARTRGWCNKHYLAWRQTGDALGSKLYRKRGSSLDEKLKTGVSKTPQCWFWLGTTNEDGYGFIRLDGKTLAAHRVYYEHYVGPIPEGLEIDHLCKNRSCVRPEHLEPVTHLENIRRSRQK